MRAVWLFFFAIMHGQRAARGPSVCLLYWQHKPPKHKALQTEWWCICLPYTKIASPTSSLIGFSHVFTAALSRTGLLWVSEWCGWKSQTGGGGEGWIGAVLDRGSQRRQASKYPNVCVRHDCRIRKHFLIKPKFVPAIFLSSVFIEVSMGQYESI